MQKILLFIPVLFLMACQNELQSLQVHSSQNSSQNETQNNPNKMAQTQLSFLSEIESKENQWINEIDILEQKLDIFFSQDLKTNQNNALPFIDPYIKKVLSMGHAYRKFLDEATMKITLIKSQLNPNLPGYQEALLKIEQAELVIEKAEDSLEKIKNIISSFIDKGKNLIENKIDRLNPFNPAHLPLYVIGKYLLKELDEIKREIQNI